MTVAEPPRPKRGTTIEERGADTTPAEEKLAGSRTWAQRLGAAMNPKLVLSQADGYPVGIKQFLQFCLILIYPAWLFFVLLAWVLWPFFKAAEGLLWLLFWPVRANQKKNHPEEYAAFLAEQKAKKG